MDEHERWPVARAFRVVDRRAIHRRLLLLEAGIERAGDQALLGMQVVVAIGGSGDARDNHEGSRDGAGDLQRLLPVT